MADTKGIDNTPSPGDWPPPPTLEPPQTAETEPSKRGWWGGIIPMCLSLMGSVLVVAGLSGPSPAGLPPAAAYQVVTGNEELYPLMGLGVILVLPGLLFSALMWRTLAGRVGVAVPLVLFIWILLHGGHM
jgi:hypothetical protein